MFLFATPPFVTQDSAQGSSWDSAESPVEAPGIVSKRISVSAQSAPEARKRRHVLVFTLKFSGVSLFFIFPEIQNGLCCSHSGGRSIFL